MASNPLASRWVSIVQNALTYKIIWPALMRKGERLQLAIAPGLGSTDERHGGSPTVADRISIFPERSGL